MNSTKTCEKSQIGTKCFFNEDCYNQKEQNVMCVGGYCLKIKYNGGKCRNNLEVKQNQTYIYSVIVDHVIRPQQNVMDYH